MTDANEHIKEIIETYRNDLTKPDSDWPHVVQRILVCIHQHRFDPRLSVGWLKEQCRINGNNFSAKFKYYVGKTPEQYWLEHRIAVAKELFKEET